MMVTVHLLVSSGSGGPRRELNDAEVSRLRFLLDHLDRGLEVESSLAFTSMAPGGIVVTAEDEDFSGFMAQHGIVALYEKADTAEPLYVRDRGVEEYLTGLFGAVADLHPPHGIG